MCPRRLNSSRRLILLFVLSVPFLSGRLHADEKQYNEQFPQRGSGIAEPQNTLADDATEIPALPVTRTRRASGDPLVKIAQEAVDVTSRRFLSTDKHTPWQIMHAVLGLRHELQILHNGRPISALGWVSQGQVFNNEYWFERTQFGGRAHPYSVPYAFEGHANQFVAILSMCGIDLDHTFGTATTPITMRELIRHAQMTITSKDEPTWTLWALSRYLPPSARWRTESGEIYSIERLVAEQTAKPMQGAPCGGTHSLFALAHARNVYLRQGRPLQGVWLQSEYKIRKYIETARMQQNSNGMLSSNYFRGREYSTDVNKRMASAGHILEFLMIALPQEELNSRWVRMAIESSARDVLANRKAYVKCSPLYHTVNALNIYLDRVAPAEEQVAAARRQPEESRMSPRPVADQSATLKSVPATSISRSETADETVASKPAETTKPTATNMPTEPTKPAETAVAANDREAADSSTDLAPEPTRPGKEIADDAADVKEVRVAVIPRRTQPPETSGWKPTSPERRRPQSTRSADPDTCAGTKEDSASFPAETTRRTVPPEMIDLAKPAINSSRNAGPTAPNVGIKRTPNDVPAKAETSETKTPETGILLPPVDAASDSLQVRSTPVRETKAPEMTGTSTGDGNDAVGGPAAEKPASAAAARENAAADELVEPNPTVSDVPAAGNSDEKPTRSASSTSESGPAEDLSLTTVPSNSRLMPRIPEPALADPFDSVAEKTDSGDRQVADSQAADSSVNATVDPASTEPPVVELRTADSGLRKVPVREISLPKTVSEEEPSDNTANPGGRPDFTQPTLKPQEWIPHFESETRDVVLGQQAIVDAVDLRPGMSIADIGAGTGLFLQPFSRAVGETGHVYAVDVSPRFVEFLERRVRDEKLTNVDVVRSSHDSLTLFRNRLDRAFLCDTFPHLERPVSLLASIRHSLVPGGELIIVTGERSLDNTPVTDDEELADIVKTALRKQVCEAGFEFVDEVSVPEIRVGWVLRFRNPR
ncbi:MAG: methyltransferase domain-containing protein [Planctomycetaceae bacterium]|nr:methyltransferase domain-containing protein [Planctomycetaceae bacterium]